MSDAILARDALAAIEKLKERLRKFSEPIAIVGWSMRGPGADSPAAFWELLAGGVDATSDVPASRWSAAEWYSPDAAAPGKARTKRGGFVSDVEHFDPAFFRISPLEASVMDPRQRFALELSHEALTRAGLPTSGGKVGVFLGASGQVRPLEIASDRATYAATGALSSVIAGRVSYTFGFTGPALVVDTACSSSLLAVHLACESLRQGACDAALAGGVSLQLDPDFTVALSKFGALARDGRCKTFDASGDGYGRGEGCGIAVLKRLSDAERDGDFVWAVIRGTASNQDGPSSGLSAPNVTAQVELARAALKQAKLTPADVQYIEAHGTGTVLGDPIEVEALTEVYGPGHSAERPLAIGSVKSNIGHLEWAAGISGLLKAVLAIHHRQIPASLHFKTPNPHIPWDQIPFRVQTSLGRWPDDTKPLAAAVSSFGFSGTNVHVVLGEAPKVSAPANAATANAAAGAPLPVAISATSEAALRAYAGRYAAFLEAGIAPPWTFRDVAFTSCVRQAHLEHRLVVASATPGEAAARLRAFAESGAVEKGVALGQARPAAGPLVFVFSGQGSQWLGMAVELFDEEPVFRAEMERCDAALRPWIDTSVIAELRASAGHARLDDGSIVQPLLFAIQASLAELWASRGVVPDVVLGHSMGEVAAAFVAGALGLEDAARVIAVRSRLMHRVRGRGAMALVGLSLEDAEREIAPHASPIAIAGMNGPRSTVVSGDAQAIADLVQRMEARDVFCRTIKIDVASHSPQLDGLRDDLLAELAPLRPQLPSKRFVSTALATSDETPAFDAAYWWTNLRQPVRFGPRIDQLIAEGHELFVEVSPHPVLGGAIDELLSARGKTARSIPSLERKRPEREALLEALGTLHARGHAVAFAKLFPDGGRVVPLPTYPWERQRFPLASPASRATSAKWPLVGKAIEASDRPHTHLFELALSLKDPSLAYFAEHRVKDAVWFPGAGFVELALEAAAEVFGDAPVTLVDVTFGQALMLSEEEPVRLQLALQADPAARSRFTIASRAGAESASWVTHVTGSIERGAAPAHPVGASLAAIEARHPDERNAGELYAAFAAQGLGYGPRFQGIARAFRGSDGHGEALVRLAPPATFAPDHARYRLHPSILDAAFQASLVALAAGSAIETFVPASIGAVRVHRSPATAAFAHASVVERPGGAAVVVIRLLDETGDVLVTVDALRLAPLGKPADRLESFLFDVAWRPSASSAGEDTTGPWWIVGSGGGIGEGLADRLRTRGAEVVFVPKGAAVADLLQGATSTPPRRVVYLESLSLPTDLSDDALETAREIACIAPLELLRGVAKKGWGTPPRVIAVTRGSQAVLGSADVVSPLPALLWGLLASAAHELAELAPTVIDLEAGSNVQTLADVLVRLDDENRIAVRGDERYVARLVRHTRSANPGATAERARHRVGDAGYRLDPTHLGDFDALALRPAPRKLPGPGEIEVRVRASGINFRDVLAVLGDGFAKGRYEASGDRLPIGGECAGVVARIGEGVTAFAPGDPVVCTPVHAFDSHVVVPADGAVKKPPGLSFEEASALPSVTMTVLWALERVGHLRKGEKILIHAATGGVGLAAVQYAKHVGAEIFATAGSPDKRAYLASLGIAHVYDSRTLAWADEVLRDTNGRGVDVVLNSLAGEAIAKGLAVLAPFGRFLEIGKRDIYANTQVGLYALRNNVLVAAIALDQLQVERPDEASALLRDVFRGLETGAFAPQPTKAFPISRAADAFSHLAMAKHIGKVVLVAEDEVDVLTDARAPAVSADRTYLIMGGLGGLGLVVARRLVTLGARHLALLGRTPKNVPELEELRAEGAAVHVLEGNAGDRASLERALSSLPPSAPPIGGIVHAAGLVADATLPNLRRESFDAVLAPKMYGARNLASLVQGPLDFFVLFSSVAAVLGSPGQANYAAANAFLDAFAHTQRARHALSIDWGAWSDVGMAVRADRADNVARQGLGALAPTDGADLFARLLSERGAIVAMDMDFRQWRQLNPQAAGLPFLRDFRAEAKTTARESPTLARLREAPPEEAGPILETYLRNAIRGITRGSLERTGVDVPLKDLGVDSLMMVSFKNVIERDLALTVSTASLYSYPTIRKLAAWALTKLGPAPAPPATAAPPAAAAPPPTPGPSVQGPAPAASPAVPEVEMSLEEALRLAGGGS